LGPSTAFKIFDCDSNLYLRSSFFLYGCAVFCPSVAVIVFLLSIVILGSITITVGFSSLSQGQQLISVTAFLNSLVPLLERIENFLRSRNLQVNLNALEAQVESSISSLGAS